MKKVNLITKDRMIKISVLFTLLLPILVPDLNPIKFSSAFYQASYGFPFNYIKMYVGTRTSWLIPQIFTGNKGVGIFAVPAVINFFLFYGMLYWVNKKFFKSKPS